MGYLHIDNLYKNQEILLFREAYAMEKIHGTSAHVSFKENRLRFFAGGCKHGTFVDIFDQGNLQEKLDGVEVVIFGEAYGGKIQRMSHTYGKEIKFVAFDVKIGDCWLSVPQAEEFTLSAGLEFVDYVKIATEIELIDEQRDRPSVQAVRNGMGPNQKREGIVLRPLMEFTKNNGNRIISKHKGEGFEETKTPREVSPEKLKVLTEARAISDEWITPMRISHVLDKIQDVDMTKMREILSAMQEDVKREAEGEIVWSRDVEKAINKATSLGVKEFFKNKLNS